MADVVIIGGGISGLSTAYYLRKAGIRSILVERRSRLGGVIATEVVDGCVIEAGPDSFLSAKPWAMDLIRDLGLAGEVIGSNDHLRVTYIRRHGRLVPLPDGLMMMVPTKVMPLVTTRAVGWATKIRMGLEWFRRGAPGTPGDRTVAEFVEDHYGKEAVDYLAEPLLAGVYGGSPYQLSINSVLNRFVELEAKYGSLTRGVLAERKRSARDSGGLPLFRTLKGGLGHLVAVLEKETAGWSQVVRGNAESLRRDGARYTVRVDGNELEAAQVILACPAYESAELVGPLDQELAQQLRLIPYSSSMTVALGYDKRGFRHPLNGFGFLVPQRERNRLIACTWVGTKFAHRVAENRVVLRCFLGGADDPGVLERPEGEVVALVREELRTAMGVNEEPVFVRISRWPRSMAQYTLGHQQRVEYIQHASNRLGVQLAGNAYYGIGIPDCARTGKQAAERIAAARAS